MTHAPQLMAPLHLSQIAFRFHITGSLSNLLPLGDAWSGCKDYPQNKCSAIPGSIEGQRIPSEYWRKYTLHTQFREPPDQTIAQFPRDAHYLIACLCFAWGYLAA